MKEYSPLHKVIQVCLPKHEGENWVCYFCWGFCKQRKMPFSTEWNDMELIISHKKSRVRWLHINSLGFISISSPPVSVYTSCPQDGWPQGQKTAAAALGPPILLATTGSGERNLLFKLRKGFPSSPLANSLYISFAKFTSHVHAWTSHYKGSGNTAIDRFIRTVSQVSREKPGVLRPFKAWQAHGIWADGRTFTGCWDVWHAFIHGWASHACCKLCVSLHVSASLWMSPVPSAWHAVWPLLPTVAHVVAPSRESLPA